jgi:hypothetical protein
MDMKVFVLALLLTPLGMSASQAATRPPVIRPSRVSSVGAHGRPASSARHARAPLPGMSIHTGSFGKKRQALRQPAIRSARTTKPR